MTDVNEIELDEYTVDDVVITGLGLTGGGADKKSLVGNPSLGRNTENTDFGMSVLLNKSVIT